jgi:hypothetical protein
VSSIGFELAVAGAGALTLRPGTFEGEFATWRAARAVRDYDLYMDFSGLRAKPEAPFAGRRQPPPAQGANGMTVPRTPRLV